MIEWRAFYACRFRERFGRRIVPRKGYVTGIRTLASATYVDSVLQARVANILMADAVPPVVHA